VGLTGGDPAAALKNAAEPGVEGLSKALREAFLEVVRAVDLAESGSPGRVKEPAGIHSTTWSADPLFYGSFSFIPVGAGIDTVEALGAPQWDGRLRIAGEATCAAEDPDRKLHYGTVIGALDSGIREARAVLKAMGRTTLPERLLSDR
jgi:hypothetical protein